MLEQLIVLIFCLNSAQGLFCYNCSATHESTSPCVGDFAVPERPFNASHRFLVNCTGGDNAMCFVRSWRARARHAWIVQRGCYASPDLERDPLPKLMTTPTRAMTCSLQRLVEAEYKVCLCQANWCNTVPSSTKLPPYFVPVLVILHAMNYFYFVFL